MKLILDYYTLSQRFGDLEGLEPLKKAGFDGLDYSFYGSVSLHDDLHYRAVRARMDELGLICPQAHAPFAMRHGMAFSPEQKEFADVLRSFEASAILGVKTIVVHALNLPEGASGKEFEEYNLAYYRALAPYAEKLGMKIAVENLFQKDTKRNCYRGVLSTPEALCRMVTTLGTDRFCACIDIGHAALTGMEPEDFIAGMTPGILGCLHVQDVNYREDSHTLPFVAGLSWEKICAALKTIGYEGDFTYEILNFLSRFPMEFLPDALLFAHNVGRKLAAKC